MDNDLARSAVTIAVSAGVLAVFFGGIWALSLRGLRISWVDVAWAAGFPLIGVVALLVYGTGEPDGPTRWLLLAMALVWGLRLATHNGCRLLRHDSEDPRYDDLLDSTDSSRATTTLVKVAAPQALTMLVVSLPLTIGANNEDHWWPLLVVGVVLWAVGVFFESVGEAQLKGFKAKKSNDYLDRTSSFIPLPPRKAGAR